MELDPKVCERAMLSGDARFDGRFFIGVLTTRIYCRPICPARMPKKENVVFLPSAAAAGRAGFRPCLRCRPESSPGTPAWLGTSATVCRALRLIDSGALDERSVEDLARRLGIGARHLSRLFRRHLGASPKAVDQTRRLHFAKKLIDETELSMAEVAFSSGFGSVRRFNDVFRQSYRRSPSELRHATRGREVAAAVDGITLRLGFRPPYDWKSLVAFLSPRATPGVEAVAEDSYCRTIELGGRSGRFEVRPAPGENCLKLRVEFPSSKVLLRIVERVRRTFDLDADPAQISELLGSDPRLGRLARAHPGIRVPGAWDGFELGVRAILGQQVTVKGATTLAARLVRRFGGRLGSAGSNGGRPELIFPKAPELSRADLTGIGLPRARAMAIRKFAAAVCRGEIRFELPLEREQFLAQLTAIPGIGEWTAEYVAMRALGDPDAFPATDLGLLRSVGDGRNKMTPAKLRDLSEAWRPWRAYAAMILWKQ